MILSSLMTLFEPALYGKAHCMVWPTCFAQVATFLTKKKMIAYSMTIVAIGFFFYEGFKFWAVFTFCELYRELEGG